jgi:hypothetical protein
MNRTIFLRNLIFLMLLVLAGCGGGGGGEKARVLGQTTDEWGAPVGGSNVTIILQGLPDVFHPAANGNFDFSVAPGTYNFEFLWYDEAQGIEINHSINRQLVNGDNNIGQIKLTNDSLSAGWVKYRDGLYSDAITNFNNYLTDVRNGHANAGANSAFDGLGWAYARLQDYNSSYANFNTAITASGRKNADALVGMGGLFLSLGYDGATFTFETATVFLTEALTVAPIYSSSPTHDRITETDVYAARALSKFLSGDIAGCQGDVAKSRVNADTSGNFATLDTLSMLEWMVGNI